MAADLRDLELNGAVAGEEGFGFETIGVAKAGAGTFLGLGLEGSVTFLGHGFIDEEADDFGKGDRAFVVEDLENGVQKFRIALAGQFGVYVGCVY